MKPGPGRSLKHSLHGKDWMRNRVFLNTVLLCWILMAPAVCQAEPEVLEELHYRVDVWLWRDAVRGKIVFARLEPGRYRVESSGESQGLLGTITGSWRGSFTTEMMDRQGVLVPVIYREESRRWGKKMLKEYRFDYDRQVLELWRWKEGEGFQKKWETPLDKPIYDALSLFYNQRLGLFGPIRGGETLTYQGIPYPQPDDIKIAIGPITPEGRKVMVSLANRVFENERSVVFVYFDGDEVPTHGWTRVLQFGKITWELLPESKRLKERPGYFH